MQPLTWSASKRKANALDESMPDVPAVLVAADVPAVHASSVERTASLEKEWECGICSDVFLDPVTLPCGHSFDFKCLTRWLRRKRTCPTCRTAVNGNAALGVNVTLRNLCEKYNAQAVARRRDGAH